MKRTVRMFVLIMSLLAVLTMSLAESTDAMEGIDSILGELEEEDNQAKVMNFDGSSLKDLGTYELYKEDAAVGSGSYRVYKFSGVNESVIDSIVDQNKARNFTAEDLEQSGAKFVVLRQYGSSGKTVMLSRNLSNYTLVFVEKGLTVDNFTFYKTCSECSGKGKKLCSYCDNTGKCSHCHGTGWKPCNYCSEKKGKCPHCGGVGQKLSSTGKLRFCTPCGGTGYCPQCDGNGFVENESCYYCYGGYGSGKCAYCKGTPEACSACGGKGRVAVQ